MPGAGAGAPTACWECGGTGATARPQGLEGPEPPAASEGWGRPLPTDTFSLQGAGAGVQGAVRGIVEPSLSAGPWGVACPWSCRVLRSGGAAGPAGRRKATGRAGTAGEAGAGQWRLPTPSVSTPSASSKHVPAAGLPCSLKGQLSGRKLIIVRSWRL